jgi:hypothetical protein
MPGLSQVSRLIGIVDEKYRKISEKSEIDMTGKVFPGNVIAAFEGLKNYFSLPSDVMILSDKMAIFHEIN